MTKIPICLLVNVLFFITVQHIVYKGETVESIALKADQKYLKTDPWMVTYNYKGNLPPAPENPDPVLE